MTLATKDQLPFGTGATKAVSGGASGAHDFTQEPSSPSGGAGPGVIAEDRPQQMGKDDTVNKDSVIEGGKLPFPETEFKDAGIKGTGSIGNNSKPFKMKG